ncbi:MAG: response regulator [Chloroflexus aggregans]|uniref:Response regulator n=1 Tax=Chloroflexus aggregans TaxID=152260 RepID=A0A2J6X7R0_9CHLR|nr:MAG: response regulator [Chloroflexus aggregans]
MSFILVVDDNFDNRHILGQMLSFSGFPVEMAANALTAIDIARQRRPSLILMDLSMPGLDGWTATEYVKNDPDLRDIPVVAVSGHVTRNDIERAKRAGCVEFLAKPIDYDQLVTIARRYVQHNST